MNPTPCHEAPPDFYAILILILEFVITEVDSLCGMQCNIHFTLTIFFLQSLEAEIIIEAQVWLTARH